MKIGIMGNVGVGKTTLCTMLKKYFDSKGIQFNLEYEEQDENPYMKDYYDDMQRWSFACQLDFLKKKFAADLKTSDAKSNWIIDRTMEEDVYVFAALQHDIGNMDDRDWQNYFDVYELMQPHVSDYDLIIYLYSDIEKISGNIIKRGRPYEQDMDLKYISKLNDKYENLYELLRNDRKTIVRINCSNLDFEHNKEDLDTIIKQIEKYL